MIHFSQNRKDDQHFKEGGLSCPTVPLKVYSHPNKKNLTMQQWVVAQTRKHVIVRPPLERPFVGLGLHHRNLVGWGLIPSFTNLSFVFNVSIIWVEIPNVCLKSFGFLMCCWHLF